MTKDLRESKEDTVGSDGNEERTSVDDEESKVSSGEDNSPPRDEKKETDSVSVRVVWVVVVRVESGDCHQHRHK